MSYKVRYRGGPNNRKIGVQPTLPKEIMVHYIPKQGKNTRPLYLRPDEDPASFNFATKVGIYSLVCTQLKDGSYFYLWIGDKA